MSLFFSHIEFLKTFVTLLKVEKFPTLLWNVEKKTSPFCSKLAHNVQLWNCQIDEEI